MTIAGLSTAQGSRPHGKIPTEVCFFARAPNYRSASNPGRQGGLLPHRYPWLRVSPKLDPTHPVKRQGSFCPTGMSATIAQQVRQATGDDPDRTDVVAAPARTLHPEHGCSSQVVSARPERQGCPRSSALCTSALRGLDAGLAATEAPVRQPGGQPLLDEQGGCRPPRRGHGRSCLKQSRARSASKGRQP